MLAAANRKAWKRVFRRIGLGGDHDATAAPAPRTQTPIPPSPERHRFRSCCCHDLLRSPVPPSRSFRPTTCANPSRPVLIEINRASRLSLQRQVLDRIALLQFSERKRSREWTRTGPVAAWVRQHVPRGSIFDGRMIGRRSAGRIQVIRVSSLGDIPEVRVRLFHRHPCKAAWPAWSPVQAQRESSWMKRLCAADAHGERRVMSFDCVLWQVWWRQALSTATTMKVCELFWSRMVTYSPGTKLCVPKR